MKELALFIIIGAGLGWLVYMRNALYELEILTKKYFYLRVSIFVGILGAILLLHAFNQSHYSWQHDNPSFFLPLILFYLAILITLTCKQINKSILMFQLLFYLVVGGTALEYYFILTLHAEGFGTMIIFFYAVLWGIIAFILAMTFFDLGFFVTPEDKKKQAKKLFRAGTLVIMAPLTMIVVVAIGLMLLIHK